MAERLLSLTWNNHSSTFCHMLSSLRDTERYTDVTVACEGKFYPLHKLVLSTCSEYFLKIFEQTTCNHPVIVVTDIECRDMEALLSYIYNGVVSVTQADLPRLIKAAEVLQIKGLAVPDEPPTPSVKRCPEGSTSPAAKRQKQDEGQVGAGGQKQSSLPHPRDEDNKEIEEVDRVTSATSLESVTEREGRTEAREANQRKRKDGEGGRIAEGGSTPEHQNLTDVESVVDSLVKEEEEIDDVQLDGHYLDLSQDAHLKYLMPNFPDGDGGCSSQDLSRMYGGDLTQAGQGGDASLYPVVNLVTDSQNSSETSNFDIQHSLYHTSYLSEYSDGRGSKIPQRYSCALCSYNTTSKGHLITHLRTHTGEKPYSCPECSFTASIEYNLKVHMRVHTGEKPFKCQRCSLKFSQKAHLKTHMFTHTGERPFSCQYCSASFSRRSNLRRHLRTHE